MRCALVENNTNLVVNVIIADPAVDPAPSGCTLLGVAEDSPVSIGWVWDGQSFVNPE
jgi:hypothetical protein